MTETASFDPVEFDPRYYARARLSAKQRVAGFIRTSTSITRSELASATGLSKSATAQLVAELLEDGLVAEVGDSAEAHRGTRRSAVLRATLPDVIVAGVHFRHDSVAAGIADMNGDLIATSLFHSDLQSSPELALERVAELVQELVRTSAPLDTPLGAVVMALPGPIDATTGIVRSPSVLSAWSGVDSAGLLATRLGLPVHVGNDADLGAWAELVRGSGRDFRHAIYLEASRGIGAGLILDGRVYSGALGIAGEIGHVQIDANGPLCRCGQNGCVEMVVSSGPLLDRLRRVHDADSRRPLSSFTDEVSARILREAGHTLGKVVAETCNVLNPQAVVVGGELGEAHPSYLDGMREALRRFAQPVIARGLVVVPGQFGANATLMGCFVRATHSVFAREMRLESEGHSLPRRNDGLINLVPPLRLPSS
ncbi:ROK family transcriptional regulator [Herbiconiux daphne]|uniref:ROK family transcriptional regulator n=1 Tax=Herbiconiux daphne TaxID=2970914 RepID=A0ABT2H6Z9_9MICO|nr:ROK family transcriptional regulator [Herbiconiux daphne]MCS5735704.1 ROK family transcriptional regulator [Herbiconiux daphne]